MDQKILAELLSKAAKDAKSMAPFLAKKVKAFQAALIATRERKPTGGRTSRANQAVQLLSNPVFNATHPAKARGVTAAAVQKSGSKFAKSLAETCSDWVIFEQAKLELSLHDTDATEHRSRENVPIENKGDIIRFVRAMKDRGIAPYKLGRLREHQLDFIGRLVIDANDDRDHEDPENLWVKSFTNGILEAVRGSMSEDEERLLAEAAAALGHPENLPLRDRLEERLGRTLDVTPGFAAACQRILDESHELTHGEQHMMFLAGGGRFSAQSENLAALLHLGTDEKKKVEAFVCFVNAADRLLTGSIVALRFGRIKDMLERIVRTFEDHKIPHFEWVPRINAVLLEEDGFIDRNLPDAETFWAILAAVLEQSETHELLQAIKVREDEDAESAFRRTQCEYLQRMGVSYHIRNDGHVLPGVTGWRFASADRMIGCSHEHEVHWLDVAGSGRPAFNHPAMVPVVSRVCRTTKADRSKPNHLLIFLVENLARVRRDRAPLHCQDGSVSRRPATVFRRC